MKKNICCQQEENIQYRWVEATNGAKHVRKDCKVCRTFFGFVEQTTIDLDKVTSTTKSKELF